LEQEGFFLLMILE